MFLLTQTSKSLDILLDPVHSQPLIPESNIEEPFFSKVVRAREAPKTETIVDRNTDNRLSNSNGLLYDERQIVALVSTTSVGKGPPMNPEGDGKLLVFVSRRTDNVQVQTVFRRLVESLVELNGQHIVSGTRHGSDSLHTQRNASHTIWPRGHLARSYSATELVGISSCPRAAAQRAHRESSPG
jgi:hypothetical protein